MVSFVLAVLHLVAVFGAAAAPNLHHEHKDIELSTSTSRSCRSLPGDEDWPSDKIWSRLNSTVGNRLIKSLPIAHVCHDPTYDEAACQRLKLEWNHANLMTSKPAEILAPWFQNYSCTPFTDRSIPCDLGNLASYSIDVRNENDIVEGIHFARRHNLRLVVKNTGHDFSGRSTGKGSLSLWTHNLDTAEIIPQYNSSYYNGPAIKVGAGITGGAAAKVASQHGYRMVVGSCPTVGPAGGYTQGGGHSLLTGLYGFAADNVLEWEVITADGDHVVATPTQNSNLYWALSGGGGGTYGVVVSMTSRVFADGKTAAATLAFNASSAGGVEPYWNCVAVFLDNLALLVNNHGIVSEFFISNDTLQVFSLLGGQHTAEQLKALVSPLSAAVSKSFASAKQARNEVQEIHDNDGKDINLTLYEGQGYYDVYMDSVYDVLVNATESAAIGGHYISRAAFANNRSGVLSALRDTVSSGEYFIGFTSFNAASGADRKTVAPVADNSMAPHARDAFLSLIIQASWSNGKTREDAILAQDQLHNQVLPRIHDAAPDAGAYGNEANWDQVDWQNIFYGSTYSKLKHIKNLFDPHGVFYAKTGVGSERWEQHRDGRLCRASIV